MGCGCSNNSGINTTHQAERTQSTIIITDCDTTKENLIAWKSILNCIKTNNLYTKAKIHEFTINQFLGVIQSALNYPTNYCYYNEQLTVFKTNILPNLLINVPECIYQ